MLDKLFVPIYCELGEVAGRPAIVVRFDDGLEPASTYLERFANEAPPERYGADIERARARIHEIEAL